MTVASHLAQVAREASKRVLGLRPFDVQLIGGVILHEGQIAEMRTGEGKTLVSVLPAFLNALTGQGVHVVTVNDYLAKRDSEWVGQVHKFLGLEVGLVQQGLSVRPRRRRLLTVMLRFWRAAVIVLGHGRCSLVLRCYFACSGWLQRSRCLRSVSCGSMRCVVAAFTESPVVGHASRPWDAAA